MKFVFDPFQAIATGVTGIIARTLVAAGVLVLGSELATVPDFGVLNPWVFALLPAALFHVFSLRGLAAALLLGTVWISAARFIRFDGGKWNLFILFASALLATSLTANWEGSVNFSQFFADGQTDFGNHDIERGWHLWALGILVLATFLVAAPGPISRMLERRRAKTEPTPHEDFL